MTPPAEPDATRPPGPETAGLPLRPEASRRLTAHEFAVAFQESFRLLWLIAVGVTRDAALSEDIVQDAAVIALRKLDEFQPGTSFNAWMGQTVRFVAYNASRREQHRRATPHDPADLDRSASTISMAPADSNMISPARLTADQPHFDDHVMRALGKLGETARSCLLLRTMAELEYAEISKLLGIPEGTAMSHVHRTRKLLRDELAPHYSSWAGVAEGSA